MSSHLNSADVRWAKEGSGQRGCKAKMKASSSLMLSSPSYDRRSLFGIANAARRRRLLHDSVGCIAIRRPPCASLIESPDAKEPNGDIQTCGGDAAPP